MTVGIRDPFDAGKQDHDPMAPWVEDTTSESGWEAIRRSYASGDRVEPLEQVIRLAKSHHVKSVVIERRYADPDWRSMYAKFYGSLFQGYAPTCHRLHLFSEVVRTGADLERFRDAYKGYTIMRPIPSHPVGRTMIEPPPGLSRATFCCAVETVRPLGYPLQVRAMPFMSQDGEYMRCSHVVQWMVLHHAHLLRNFARRLPDEIHFRSQGGLVVSRQMPSGGLSLPQMLGSLHALGLSPDKVLMPPGSQDASRRSGLFSLPATMCRYVNSQMPPIIISENHAWVVVGYRNRGDGPDHDTTSFYVHDDLLGPYIAIDDPWSKVKALEEASAEAAISPAPASVAKRNGDVDPKKRLAEARGDRDRGVWSLAVPPLPQRVNLSADRAEFVGRVSLLRVSERTPKSSRLLGARRSGRLSFRTYAIRSNEFKEGLQNRGLPEDLCAYYREANWPGFIWVVEAIHKDRFAAGLPCVLGETIIDSTATHVLSSHQRRSAWPARAVLAVHVPGKASIAKGSGVFDDSPFQSGLPDALSTPSGLPEGGTQEPRRHAYNLRLPEEDAETFYGSGCLNGNW